MVECEAGGKTSPGNFISRSAKVQISIFAA